MVNERFYGERHVDAMNCRDFFPRNIIPAARGAAAAIAAILRKLRPFKLS
jgi:hypothetical protein